MGICKNAIAGFRSVDCCCCCCVLTWFICFIILSVSLLPGMSPFSSNNERQVKASYSASNKRAASGLQSSPSMKLRPRTAVLTTRPGSKLKSEMKAEKNNKGGLFRL